MIDERVVGVSLLSLLLIGGGWRSSSRGRLAAVGAIADVLVLSGVAASMSRNGQHVDSFDPHDDVCSSGSVEICLNRGYAAALAPLVRQVTAMNDHAAGTPLVAVRLQHGTEGGPAPRAGFRNVYVDYLAGKQDIAFAVSRYVQEYGASPACQTSGALVGRATLRTNGGLARSLVVGTPARFEEGHPAREPIGAVRTLLRCGDG